MDFTAMGLIAARLEGIARDLRKIQGLTTAQDAYLFDAIKELSVFRLKCDSLSRPPAA